ncbi:MAG: TolC family protein [Planctomycetes bacterium]|nr:TolC family protein [Planctomycetota bacterium]
MRKSLPLIAVAACLIVSACHTRVTEVEPSEAFRKALDEVMLRQPDEKLRVRPDDLASKPRKVVLRLSLEDCLELSAARNRAILFSQLSVELRRAQTMTANGALDATAGATFKYTREQEEVQSRFGGDTRDRSISGVTTYGISGIFPFATGTTAEVTGAFVRSDTNNPFQTFEFFPETTFMVRQHLLNGFGLIPNLGPIWLAEGAERIAEFDLAATRNLTAFNVANAYWDLVASIKDVEVLQSQRKLALEALDLANNRLNAGIGTRLDVLAQESNLAAQEVLIIKAEALVGTCTDDLLYLVHPELLTGYAMFDGYKLEVQPQTQPDDTKLGSNPITLLGELKGALGRRPEIAAARKTVDLSGLSIEINEWGLLPTLDVEGEFAVAGFGVTSNDSFENYGDFDNLRYGVGFTFGVPIQNRRARGALEQAVVNKRNAILAARDAETGVIIEVAAAVRLIETGREALRAARKAQELASETYKAVQERQAADLATAFEVNQAQNDLTAAKRDFAKATVDVEKAYLALRKATGEMGR